MFKSLKKVLDFGILLWSVPPILIMLWIIAKYPINVPFYDDFFWCFEFLNKYFSITNFAEKFSCIIAQHGQHRIGYSHLVMLVLYKLQGNIDIRFHIFMGNLGIFAIFFLWLGYLFKSKLPLVYICPPIFIWFSVQYYFNITISYGLPNISIIALALASFFVFSFYESKRSLIFCCILGGLGMFANGNGIIIGPILLFLTLVQKDWKRFVFIGLFFLVLFLIYFYHYYFHKGIYELHVDKIIAYFLYFLSVSFLPQSKQISLVWGILGLLTIVGYFGRYFLLIIKKGIQLPKQKVFLLCVVCFLVGTSVIVAVGRGILNEGILTWYRNYSLLFLIVWYFIFLDIIYKSWFRWIYLYAMVLFFSFVNYKNLISNIVSIDSIHNQFEADALNFKSNGIWSYHLAQVGYKNFLLHNEISRKLYKEGKYIPPIVKMRENVKTIKLQRSVQDLNILDSTNKDNVTFELKINEPSIEKIIGFLKAPNSSKLVYFGLTKHLNFYNKMLMNGSFFDPSVYNFSLGKIFFKEAIEKNVYNIGFYIKYNDGSEKWIITDKAHQILNI